ncbi:MAG: NDP-sugar synthase [Vicinamibacterales bacterium]
MIDTAILLAAGLGTRLAPLSRVRAKGALPVAGEILLRRQLRWLAGAGVRRVVVNLHHLPATIAARVGHGDDLGVEVRYSWEPVVLGSAGGPRRAFDLLDADRAFIVNGDTLTNLDLAALAGAHAAHRPLVTLAATPEARPGYNALVVDDDGRWMGVARLGQALPPAFTGRRQVHFIGVQLAERAAFAGVPAGTPSETLKAVYPALLAHHASAVRVMPAAVAFHDIGTPAEYVRTVHAVAAAEGRGLDRGAGVEMDATADVRDTILWDDVRIAAGAHVRGCVLADGVRIPAGARLVQAAVIRRAQAPAGLAGHAEGDLWITPLDAAAG